MRWWGSGGALAGLWWGSGGGNPHLVGLWWGDHTCGGYGGAMVGLWGGYGGAIAPHLRALSPPTLFIRPPFAGAIAPP
jgi:hypothetical protein